MNELTTNLTQDLSGNAEVSWSETLNAPVVTTSKANLIITLKFLRDSKAYRCQQLIDVMGTDYPEKENRFTLTYSLLSLTFNHRIYVRLEAVEEDTIPSVTKVYPTADWFEREVYDMFGVYFEEHPDLRRILTDYGFEGHPLRKDFPLTGYVEVRYDLETKRVIYEPVNLAQDFRNFDSLTPWEGTEYKK